MSTTTRADTLRLGRFMHGARIICGLSQRETARRLGIAQSSLSAYEHGRCVPWDVRHDFADMIATEALRRRAADVERGI